MTEKKIKEIIIKVGDKEIKITDEVITVSDLKGFPLIKVMPDKIKVKKELKILRI